MNLPRAIHPGRWFPDRGRLRRPSGSPDPAGSSDDASPAAAELQRQVTEDQATLENIAAGLERLEERLDRTEVIHAANQRGYFTPDEDDRVRQTLLAYRNYRLALYEILFRHEGYRELPSPRLRLRVFTLVYAAALLLYARSLKLIQVAEHEPLLRAKLNEPDTKFGLAGGFFNDVLAGYSTLRHYRRLAAADWFWVRHRRLIRSLGLTSEPAVEWRCALIRKHRRIVRHRFLHVLSTRLRYDWRHFMRSLLAPVERTGYGLKSLVGGRFAGLWLHPEPEPVLNAAVLHQLRPRLRSGDILLIRAEGKLTAALLPGFWAHAAIYVGRRQALESLPLAGNPHLRRHLSRVPMDGGPSGSVIESVSPCVRLTTLAACLEGDHVLVLRPQLTPAERAAALNEAFGHLGKLYDFEFDFNVSSRMVCTELVYRAFHGRGGLAFTLTKRLGRFTLTGDDLANLALDLLAHPGPGSPSPLAIQALVLRRRDGLAHFVEPRRALPILRRIQAGWRPFHRDRLKPKPPA